MKRLLRTTCFAMILFNMFPSSIYAANGQGSGQGRVDTVNANDYSTNNWDRFDYNYVFNSGPDTKEIFGVPTETEVAPKNPQNDNIRRNKDAAFVPPSYGVYSGEIPTYQSNPYITSDKDANAITVSNSVSAADAYYGNRDVSAKSYGDGTMLPSTSTLQTSIGVNTANNVSISYTGNAVTDNNYLITAPSFYDDGSMGTLSIAKLKLNVKVYEGETLDSMKKGLGHFQFTSAWDGTVGIAGHNRGSSGYLQGVKDLRSGDEITYQTKYGTRVYEVYAVDKISDTDYSKLNWTTENRLVLITCVENEPSYRYAISAREK